MSAKHNQRVLISGGPGAGKTTLLQSLSMPYQADQARAIIRERRALGLRPRPDALSFARAILRREIASYQTAPDNRWVLFERGIPDALAQVVEAGGMTTDDAKVILARHPYHVRAFLLPPWELIYRTDEERDQNFAEAKSSYAWVRKWYERFGFDCVEVPIAEVGKRAAFIRQQLKQQT